MQNATPLPPFSVQIAREKAAPKNAGAFLIPITPQRVSPEIVGGDD